MKAFSATVSFSSITDAQEAVKAYDKKEGIFGNQIVELKHDDTAEVWFGQTMYEALQEYIKVLLSAKSPYCVVRFKSSSDLQSMVIKLHSSRSDPADVLPTKRALDELNKGESFFVNANEAQKLNNRKLFNALQKKHQGFLFIAASSSKNRRIVVRGSPEAREETMLRLTALRSDEDSLAKRKVQLPPGGAKVLLGPEGRGLDELNERFKVKFDLNVRLQTLFFDATDAVYDAVVAFAASLSKKKRNSPSPSSEECIVCLDPITDPFVMVLCGHSLCRGCVKASVLSRINNTDYPITCDCCGTAMAMKDIMALLDDKDMLRLVNTAVNSYMTKHSDSDVKPCMHPGCAGFTRSVQHDTRVTCSLCTNAYCSACEVPYHEGQSCELFKQEKSGELAVQRFLEENKSTIRPCFRCKTPVMKNMGCNHMTCFCGAHFCWLCGAGFEDAAKTYAHLNQIHGGIASEDDLIYDD